MTTENIDEGTSGGSALTVGLEPPPQPTVLMRVMPGDYRYGDVMGYTAAQMRAYAAKCVANERKACWDSVNAAIKQGPLQGSGWDDSAQRNGLILASNIIMERIGSNAQGNPPASTNIDKETKHDD